MDSNKFDWWQSAVIYQIYPRSFKDSNGDGVGDLQGIIDKLDYLKGTPNSLDVDAIWISPIYVSPMIDFGYDVANHIDIDPLFGDLETFDRLVEEAHQRNLKIILDFVPNHTSDQHTWFKESRSSRDNVKRDWYYWRDAKPDGSYPNNWVSMFGGRAWTWDETTQQYYLHLFDKTQPDLNWRNPAVKSAMLDVLRFWLDRGVDGFRMDVVGFIMKDEKLPDNPLSNTDLSADDLKEWHHLIHKYDIDQPEVHELIKDFRQLHDEYGNRVVIGEIWAEPRSEWIKYYGKNNDGLHLPFNFDLINKPWDVTAIRNSVNELEGLLDTNMWPNYVLGSHDKQRLATRYGDEATRLSAMLLLTLRGTPTLYMGDEIGMIDGKIPIDKIQDPQGINLGADNSRDGCRTPFQWSSEDHAGFSSVEPWLPIAENFLANNVVTHLSDPNSLLNLYRKLIQLRKSYPSLAIGTYQYIATDQTDCFIYIRRHDNEACLIALNFANESRTVCLDLDYKIDSVLLSTSGKLNQNISLKTLELRSYEGVVIKLNITSVRQ